MSGVFAGPLRTNDSPYLSMHLTDPVAWRGWDADVLSEARAQNKLIFITSGYFSCHWCHVMQRESFLAPAVAKRLNEQFIPVVIDRELRPQLDAKLVRFVEQTQGAAGWPLNVLLTPQGYPLVGATYLPNEHFINFLDQVNAQWQQQPARLRALARKTFVGLNHRKPSREMQPNSDALTEALLQQVQLAADEFEGGFGQQTKFPMSPQLQALLQLYARQPNPELREFINRTLESIAYRGLRDTVGGGFFRYTVDPGWREPHFEKMLDDNAQLTLVFLAAARILDDERWLAVANDTLKFVLRDMRHPEGGFISALSAVDGEGREGAFYLWQDEELQALLGHEQATLLRDRWHWYAFDGADASGLLPMHERAVEVPEQIRERLHEHRRRRLQLPRDAKRIAAGNGLLLSALSKAIELDRTAWLPEARALREAIHSYAIADDDVQRRFGGGGTASAEDYLLVARGLLDFHDAVDSPSDLALARQLTQRAWERFTSENGWNTSPAALLPGQLEESLLGDSTLPSPSALMFELLHRLRSDNDVRISRLNELLRKGAADMQSAPLFNATQIVLLGRLAQ